MGSEFLTGCSICGHHNPNECDCEYPMYGGEYMRGWNNAVQICIEICEDYEKPNLYMIKEALNEIKKLKNG